MRVIPRPSRSGGNVVFQSGRSDSSRLAREVRAAINKDHGFEPHVLLLDHEKLERSVASNPFPEAESEPKTLHVGFLSATPTSPDLPSLEGLRRETERFHLEEDVFYLHASGGVGRSKLAANAERLLGVSMTDRNWRTVCKLVAMARQCHG